MRDLFLTLCIFGTMPLSVMRPYIGLLMWSWIAYMNPHRLTWGFAYHFRFNYFVAIATLAGLFYNKEVKLRVPFTRTSFLMFLFTGWTTLTSYYAFNDTAWWEWNRFIKIQVMIIVTFIVVKTKKDIHFLIMVIAVSIGFYGFKGGIFTITTGGQFQVLGPGGSFFRDNNTFALAMIVTVPLFNYLQMQTSSKLFRIGFISIGILSSISIIGSYSRGGLVGFAVLAAVFWLKTRKKLIMTIIFMLLAPPFYQSMPEKWHNRMDVMLASVNIPQLGQKSEEVPIPTLMPPKENNSFDMFTGEGNFVKEDAEIMKDLSVQGRMDAWNFAIALANHRPFVGGGFQTFSQDVYNRYYPNVYRRDAHSIYFEVLAEQGYAGFIIWILMHLSALHNGRWIIKKTKGHKDLLWARDLAGMLQVGLVGYYAAGAFLGLAYFDLPYHFISIIIITKKIVEDELEILKLNKPVIAEVKSIF